MQRRQREVAAKLAAMLLTICVGAAAAVAAAACYLALAKKGPRRGDPASPGWLPVVGSMPYLPASLQSLLTRRFGSEQLVLMHIGLERLYCLNSFSALKEALVVQGDKFLSRPSPLVLRSMTGESGGLIMASGQQWRDYRRFTVRTLRDFGLGRRGVEEIVQLEAQLLCDRIERAGSEALDTVPLFSTAISNVICQLVFGSRLASEDPKFERILKIFELITQSNSHSKYTFLLLLNAKYFARPLAWLLVFLRRRRFNFFEELLSFCREQMEKHRREMQDVAHPKDYIEAHLLHQETHPEFNEVRLTICILDLFIAGSDSTSHTLRWAVLFMIENPHVADKVFDEIKIHVGLERQIGVKDKSVLHYTTAVVEETHRMASLAHLGLLHEASEDAVVCGHTIPAGSAVIYNVYNIHHSPLLFPQPHQFKPERFLNEEGHFVASEHVVPFGVGKRSCLGEGLARTELFIFFSTLMQRFRFRLDPADGRDLEEIKENVGHESTGVRVPAVHKVEFTRR